MARSVLVVSALAIASCGGCGCGKNGAPDAGLDAGTDAGVDGGRDAGIDAGQDAGPQDAGPAGWVPLPGLPGACVVERAENPSAVFDPRWVPCVPGVVGCVRLAGMRALLDGVGAYDNERGYFALLQRDATDAAKMNLVLAATVGAPLGAWRSPPDVDSYACRLWNAGLGSGGAMFTVRTRVDPYRQLVYWAPLDSIGAAAAPVAELTDADLGSGAIQETGATATLVAFDAQPASRIFIADGAAVHQMERLPGALAGAPFGPEVVGDHVMWEERGTQNRIAHGTPTEPTSLYYEAGGGMDVAFFDTSDTDLAWVQVQRVAGAITRFEVWTAPYVRDPASLEPRMLYSQDADFIVPLWTGARRVVMTDVSDLSVPAIWIFDLATGRRVRWEFPPGHMFGVGGVLAVGERELLLHGVGPDGQTAMRVDLETAPLEPVP